MSNFSLSLLCAQHAMDIDVTEIRSRTIGAILIRLVYLLDPLAVVHHVFQAVSPIRACGAVSWMITALSIHSKLSDEKPRPFPRALVSCLYRSTIQAVKTSSRLARVPGPPAVSHPSAPPPLLSAPQSIVRKILVPAPEHHSPYLRSPRPCKSYEPRGRARRTRVPAPGAGRSHHSASVGSRTSQKNPPHR